MSIASASDLEDEMKRPAGPESVELAGQASAHPRQQEDDEQHQQPTSFSAKAWDACRWTGGHVFNGMTFLGEVFADFFGVTDSKYQYVVDAYERYLDEREKEAQHREHIRQKHLQMKAERDHRRAARAARRAQALESGGAAGATPEVLSEDDEYPAGEILERDCEGAPVRGPADPFVAELDPGRPGAQFGSHPGELEDDGFAGAAGRVLHYPNVLAQSTAAPSDTEAVEDVIQQRIQDGEGYDVEA